MHPNVVADSPGRCPECGMNLLPLRGAVHDHRVHTEGKPFFAQASEGKHAGHNLGMFLRKFWVSFALTVPVVLYSELPERFFGWVAPAFPGSPYLAPAFGSVVFFYGGRVFLAGAWRELNARLPGMMTLIGIAISAAYLYSVAETIRDTGHTLFWELTTLITVMLLGHWIEMKAVQGSQSALKELSKLLPDTAEVILQSSILRPQPAPEGLGQAQDISRAESRDKNQNDPRAFNIETRITPLSELKVGDRVFVRPGGKIPADGVVLEGASQVDEAMVTGESKPVEKRANAEVIAGTINGDGSLTVEVTKIGEHTFLAGVMKLVAEAQSSKSRLQILSDRAALYLTVVAVATGTITFVAWVATRGGFGFAVERLVAVLVIACPHALGLAVPLVASISTTLAARNGFLVRQRLALEMARNVDVVLFDKTGTLTKGEYGVTSIIQNDAARRPGDLDVLQLAASVDAHSEHFVARALVREVEQRGLATQPVADFVRVPGKGVKGVVAGMTVFVGGEAILEDARAGMPSELRKEIARFARRGNTLIYVAANRTFLGAVALADIIREESRQAVSALKELGITTAILTGDSEDVAQWVARELGIDEYFARVLPREKADKVKLLQAKGQKVVMVGDGINDAPALTQADVGIAIGAGTNVAIESAGIILVRNDPRDIVKIIRLSRRTYAKMVQNLFWATGYNVVALPLAAGVLASRGVMLEPAVAALFMSLSTVIVAINATLLRRQRL